MKSRSCVFAWMLSLVLLAFSASAQTVWSSSPEDLVAAFDLKTGKELAEFEVRGRLSDLTVLPNQHVVLNHRAKSELVLFDARTRKEVTRLPSSRMGGVNPHHGYLLKTAKHTLYAVAHDGENRDKDSTVAFFEVLPQSPGLAFVGEVRVGAGHHKLAHFPGQDWVSVSNINDCDQVLSVLDVSQPEQPRVTHVIGATQLGYTGDGSEKRCDATGKQGRALRPHGAAASQRFHVHNFNGTGQMAVIKSDGTVRVLDTQGSGGASGVALPDGSVVMTQFAPREGGAGAACQVGQLAWVSATGDQLQQIPVRMQPDCAQGSKGARLGYASLAPDQKTLLLPLSTMGNDAEPAKFVARMRLEDGKAVQLSSVAIGEQVGHRDHGWLPDGSLFVFPNGKGNTVSVVDPTTGEVTVTIPVQPNPLRAVLTQP